MKKITTWYVDSAHYCIVECARCGKPMVVLKTHGKMCDADLKFMQKVADDFVKGESELYTAHGTIDVDVHPHYHIRKKKKVKPAGLKKARKSLDFKEFIDAPDDGISEG